MLQQMRLTSDHNLLLPQEEVVIKKEKATTTAEHRPRVVGITKPPAPETYTRASHANYKV